MYALKSLSWPDFAFSIVTTLKTSSSVFSGISLISHSEAKFTIVVDIIPSDQYYFISKLLIQSIGVLVN